MRPLRRGFAVELSVYANFYPRDRLVLFTAVPPGRRPPVGHAEAFGDPEVVDPPVVVGKRAFLASTAARRQCASPERVHGARDPMGYLATHGSSGEPEMSRSTDAAPGARAENVPDEGQ